MDSDMVPSTHYLANLGRHVSWLQVLPLLGENWVSVPPNALLPRRFDCPLCPDQGQTIRPQAVIYADLTLGGEWVHCPWCGFAGDVIEFSAAKWKLDPITTVRELAARGMGPPATHMAEDVLQAYSMNLAYRRKIDDLWQSAKAALPRQETVGVKELAYQLGFLTDLNHAEWLHRGGRFIGATNIDTLHQLLQPRRSQPRRSPTRSGHSPRSPNAWLSPGNPLLPDSVILPLYDLPGRISSWVIIGNARRSGSLQVICKRLKTDRSPATSENGVWMFDNLLGGTENDRGTTFVLDDPLLALQLQIQHLLCWPKSRRRCQPSSPPPLAEPGRGAAGLGLQGVVLRWTLVPRVHIRAGECYNVRAPFFAPVASDTTMNAEPKRRQSSLRAFFGYLTLACVTLSAGRLADSLHASAGLVLLLSMTMFSASGAALGSLFGRAAVTATILTIPAFLILCASMVGIVGFHYPHFILNEPFRNPQKVVRVEGNNIFLESGAAIAIDPDFASGIYDEVNQAGYEIDSEGTDGESVAIWARREGWICGTPWAQPIRIPLIRDTVYKNRRVLIAIGSYVESNRKQDGQARRSHPIR